MSRNMQHRQSRTHAFTHVVKHAAQTVMYVSYTLVWCRAVLCEFTGLFPGFTGLFRRLTGLFRASTGHPHVLHKLQLYVSRPHLCDVGLFFCEFIRLFSGFTGRFHGFTGLFRGFTEFLRVSRNLQHRQSCVARMIHNTCSPFRPRMEKSHSGHPRTGK